MLQEFRAAYCSATGTVFKTANLTGASLYNGKFRNADFSGANLVGVNFNDADLTGAKFTGADLSNALLTEAKLVKAELRKASLRNANLAGADLTGALIDGADFTGTNVFGAKLGRVDVKKAKGLAAGLQPTRGHVGPNIRLLENIGKRSEQLQFSAKVEREGRPTVTMRFGTFDKTKTFLGMSMEAEPGAREYVHHPSLSTTVPDLFLELARQWADGELLFDSIRVSIKKGPVNKKQLLPIAVAAWSEAFGLELPSEGERQATRQRARDEFLRLLKKGKKGIE